MESSSQRFKALHNELQVLLKAEAFDEDLLQKKITKYIAFMVEGHAEEQEQMFDHFCEYNGTEIFSRLMAGDPLLAIKSYSLLFINLKNEMWISYILCQPFLMEAITLKCESKDEEYTEYFVSFLKSLSIRINSSQITLFYNKRNCTFPLVMAAMKYFNHPDFMVRTSVMNIILELMKIQQAKAQEYFSRFPFTSYIITFACEVNQLIALNHQKIQQSPSMLQPKHLGSYNVDISDYLYYFNDLVEFGTPRAVEVIEQSIISYLIVPIFNWFLTGNDSAQIHALLLIHQCLRIIKSKHIVDIITLLLFRTTLSDKPIDKIRSFEGVYQPEVFRKEFSIENNYWGEYENEIVGHCLEIFKDIEKFDIDYEAKNQEDFPKFKEEVKRISTYISYDLLENSFLGERFQQQLQHESNNTENPIKERFVQLLADANFANRTLATSIVLNVLHNSRISQSVLQVCGLNRANSGSQPTVLSDFMQQIKSSLLSSIVSINWEQTRVKTLSNTLNLLNSLMTEPESIEFEEELLKNYRKVTAELKEHVKAQNMNLLVEKFSRIYFKAKDLINKDPCESSIPYAMIMLPQEKWDELNEDYCLPTKPAEKVVHLIKHFFVFRSFVTGYFSRFYDAEYTDFEELHSSTFQLTSLKWKTGQNYKITNRTLILCAIESKEEKKQRKAMIIEDQHSFVLAELTDKLCKIVVNENWKRMSFEISKEDGTWIEVVVSSGSIERYRLVFEDQVRSNTTLVLLNDIKWESYQFELSFINKFLKSALEE